MNYTLLCLSFLLLSFLFSWLIVVYLTPIFMRSLVKRGYLGKDMNKFSKPLVCELGGLPVFFSFIISLLFVFCINFILFIFLNTSFPIINIISFFTIIITIFLIFLMGITDDILGWKKGITQLQHFFFALIFSLPFVIYSLVYKINSIYIPLIGTLNVGIIYAIIFVPIAISATTNLINLLAGFNGLEAGMGLIIFLTISLFSFFKKEFTLLLVLMAWCGALIGFLRFNKFPAKIFPGDIITLINGVLVGISAIILQLEFLIAFLIILYIIEFIIKAKHKFKTECFGIIQKNHILKPNPNGGSLTHFVLRQGKFTEKKLVNIFYLLQMGISFISIILFWIVYL